MEKNKIIKGFSKKYKYYAGMILAGSISLFTPQHVSANEFVNGIEKSNEQTDLEKYFTSDILMNKDYQITTDSDIYKIIVFYEGKPEAQNGQYFIERDPDGNLVIAGGLTVKYQENILEYIRQNYGANGEINSETVDKMDLEGFCIPEYIINNRFITEIQECRTSAISAAEEYGINLSEAQINILTELNFRYGKGQSGLFLKSLTEGASIKDFTVTLERKTGTVQEKPFKGMDMETTIDNLKSIDIASEVNNSNSFQFEGDKRRGLFRQIGIMYNVSPIIINNAGTCRYFENGETKETDLINYLENVKGIVDKDYTVSINEPESYEVPNVENIVETESSAEPTIEDIVETENSAEPTIEDIVETENYTEPNLEDTIETESPAEQNTVPTTEQIAENILDENELSTENKETALVPRNNKIKIPIISSIVAIATALVVKLKNRKKSSNEKVEESENGKSVHKANELRKRLKVKNEEEKREYLLALGVNKILKTIEEERKMVDYIHGLSPTEKNVFQRQLSQIKLSYENGRTFGKEAKQDYKKAKAYMFILKNYNLTDKLLKLNPKEQRKLKKNANREILKYRRKMKKNNRKENIKSENISMEQEAI